MGTTKFYARHSHVDVMPAFGKYILAVRDGIISHAHEPEACYEINRVWQYAASKLEEDLSTMNVLRDFFSFDGTSLLVCDLEDKLVVDKVLARYAGNNPRRPVSKSA